MSEIERGFREALRRIDALPTPVAPIAPEAVVARGEAARRRRARLRALLVAAAVALVATVIGLAGLLSGRGQAGPVVVGVPSTPPPAGRLVVQPAPADPSTGEVLLDDPGLLPVNRAGEVGPTAFSVDGNTVSVADPITGRIVVYTDGTKTGALDSPVRGAVTDLVVRDGTWYLLADGRVHAYALRGAELVERGALPAAVTAATDVVELVVDADHLVAVRQDREWLLVAGPGPLPEPPDVRVGDADDRVLVQDGRFEAEILTRHSALEGSLVARDAQHVWYETWDSRYEEAGGNIPQGCLYEFTRAGELVATYTYPINTTTVPHRQVTVVDGQVYWLRVTQSSAMVLRLRPSPSGSPLPSATTLPDGFRRVQYDTIDTGQRVELGVPESWGEAYSPPADYCFRDSFAFPDQPYADTNHGTDQRHATDCAALTAARQALHVTVTDPSAITPGPPWDGDTPGWRQWSSTVDGVVVTVTGRTSDATLAQQILATVRVT